MKMQKSIALLLMVLLATSSLALAEEPPQATQAAARPIESANVADNKPLPDAPSAVARESSNGAQPERTANLVENRAPKAPVRSASTAFWVASEVLLSSSLVNVEMIAHCKPGSCQSVPDPLRNRGALYGIAIPTSFGVSYLSYRLKRSGSKWWFVPVAAATAANIVYAAHAAKYSR